MYGENRRITHKLQHPIIKIDGDHYNSDAHLGLFQSRLRNVFVLPLPRARSLKYEYTILEPAFVVGLTEEEGIPSGGADS